MQPPYDRRALRYARCSRMIRTSSLFVRSCTPMMLSHTLHFTGIISRANHAPWKIAIMEICIAWIRGSSQARSPIKLISVNHAHPIPTKTLPPNIPSHTQSASDLPIRRCQPTTHSHMQQKAPHLSVQGSSNLWERFSARRTVRARSTAGRWLRTRRSKRPWSKRLP